MKRLIATIVILAFAVALMAAESDPSETVGFYNFTTPVGYTLFSHPFTYYDATHTATLDLDDIIADQLSSGTPANADRIIDANTLQWAFYAPPWTGSLVNFNLANAYYVKIYDTANDVYLAGSVEQDVIDYGTMDAGYNIVGLKEAGSVALAPDGLDLLASGFTPGTPATSDRIIDANTLQWAFHNGTTWFGSLTQTTIGHTYYILVNNTPFNWIYDPTSKGTTVTRTVTPVVETKAVTPTAPKITTSTKTAESKVKVQKIRAKSVNSSNNE